MSKNFLLNRLVSGECFHIHMALINYAGFPLHLLFESLHATTFNVKAVNNSKMAYHLLLFDLHIC